IIGNTTGSVTGGSLTVTSALPTSLTPIDLVVATPLDLQMTSNIVDNGDVNSPVALTKTGTGMLTVSGANTYSNNTYVNGGKLKIGGAAALPSTTTVVMSNTAGAILDLNGNSVSVAGLTGGGTSGGEVQLSGGATLTITAAAADTFGGVISG